MDPVTDAQAGQVFREHITDTPWGTAKALGLGAGIVAVSFGEHGLGKWAILGICVLGSPALAKTLISPYLASILKRPPQ